MSVERLRERILAAARQDQPKDAVPYAFEKRVMARIEPTSVQTNLWAVWNRVLWRVAAPCVGLTLLLSAWSFLSEEEGRSTSYTLADDLERVVYAPFDDVEDVW